MVFSSRARYLFLFSNVRYLCLAVFERKGEGKARFYYRLAVFVRIPDAAFFVNNAVCALMYGIVAIVILKHTVVFQSVATSRQ